MRFSTFVLPLMAASTQAFVLSPTCLSTYHKALNKMDDYIQLIKAHVCDQGCVVSFQTYEEIIKEQSRPALKKALADHLDRGQSSDADIEKMLEMSDTVSEMAVESCDKLENSKTPASHGIPSAKKGDADLCEDPSLYKKCVYKMKTKIPSIAWKHTSTISSFTDNKTCRKFSAALDDPEFWALFKESLDAYAQTCPTRG